MWTFSIICLLLSLLAAATPVPAPDPSALSLGAANAFTDFPVNVVFTAGAAQFGVEVPENGFWYSTNELTCLNALANAYGACDIPSFDRVGVVAGQGPCSIMGFDGFIKTIAGNAGEGFTDIAPPQRIQYMSCGGYTSS